MTGVQTCALPISFLEPGDLDALLDEVEGKMKGVLESLVIDTESDHNTQDTARRVAKMYLTEVFRGRYVAPPPVTEFPNAERLNELMIVGPITVRSACSHHFCPIMGRLWIGLMPNEHSNLIGLSKYSRLAEWVMSRPQIQEEAITQMAELLMRKVSPDGLAVVMEADHFCMHWRGVKDAETKMINSVMRGSFLKDATLRLNVDNLFDKIYLDGVYTTKTNAASYSGFRDGDPAYIVGLERTVTVSLEANF